jgi:D-beta-D-heptose 7-phosphate kinase/D-beta-D-heptose 1-phosphate adenosyltransferase
MTTSRLIAQVEGLPRPKALVLGDLLLDRYVWGSVGRISPEAPIPVLKVEREEFRLGGAANVALNLRSLGARVTLAGIVGQDAGAKRFEAIARKARIGTEGVVHDPSRPTSSKSRMMAQRQQVLRVDREDVRGPNAGVESALIRRIEAAVRRVELAVISDYQKGTLTKRVARAAVAACRRAGVPLFVGLKSLDSLKYRGATAASLNRAELRALTGRDDLESGARKLLARLGLQYLLVTLGEEGMAVFPRGVRPVRLPTVARQVFDVTGAGDTALAGFALAARAGLPLPDCARIANAAAGVVVGKVGTAQTTRAEIVEQLRTGGAHSAAKIVGEEALARELDRERRLGRRIVFTNGCFDLLHAGHMKILQFAKAQGDTLVVGINSDRSVRRLKGEGRPILSQEERALMLSGIEACDRVVIFDEATPARLIRRLRPDVLVKGEDWQRRGVVGSGAVRNHGGRVVLAPIFQGLSSSRLIERILKRYRNARAVNPEAKGRVGR